LEADVVLQILRNDPSPAVELAVEKELSSFSRFTRAKYAFHLFVMEDLDG
jgi:hypothetical protein